MTSELDILRLVTSRLDGAGIPYMVTGSMAAAYYAEPRMTRDADLVVELTASDASRLASMFEDFNADADLILSKLCWARDSRSELQLRDVRRLLTSGTELDAEYLNRWAKTLGVADLLHEVRVP